MKAQIKRLHSPDIRDLKEFTPEHRENFSFLLQCIVGPSNEEGEESFDMVVCTPAWLTANHEKNEVLFGLHYLIVFEYNYNNIFNKLNKFVQNLEANSWRELASKLGRIGRWEFEDYSELKINKS